MTSRDAAIMWFIGIFVALSCIALAYSLARDAADHAARSIVNACGAT